MNELWRGIGNLQVLIEIEQSCISIQKVLTGSFVSKFHSRPISPAKFPLQPGLPDWKVPRMLGDYADECRQCGLTAPDKPQAQALGRPTKPGRLIFMCVHMYGTIAAMQIENNDIVVTYSSLLP